MGLWACGLRKGVGAGTPFDDMLTRGGQNRQLFDMFAERRVILALSPCVAALGRCAAALPCPFNSEAPWRRNSCDFPG